MANANVKITELTTWTPVNTDWIPFVDISDTTQSAQWTTKKALKSDLKGDTGDNATVTVWTTTTWAPWTNASVTNVWTTSDAIFDFVIPRWDTWATGATGATWPQWLKWDKWDTWATWAAWVVQSVNWYSQATIVLSTADIADSLNKRYVTDANLTVLWNTSGTNTWDQTNITGNAWTVTNWVYTTGSYSDPTWITSLSGSKISWNISWNAANVTGTVAIANGGTGQTSAQNAINALTQVSGATNEYVLTKDTGTGNATWKASTWWLTWWATANGATGTWLALSLDNSYAASGIWQSITIWNTQTNALKWLKIDTGTANVLHYGIDVIALAGRGINVNSTTDQAVWAPRSILLGSSTFNNNSSNNSIHLLVNNADNASTWVNSGVQIVNYYTTATLSSGNQVWCWLNIIQAGADGTALTIDGTDNVNSSTNGLFNITLSNTQSALSKLMVLNTGTSNLINEGINITALAWRGIIINSNSSQAVWAPRSILLWSSTFNNNSSNSSVQLLINNADNASTWLNTWIQIANYYTAASLSSGNQIGCGINVIQAWVDGTAINIDGIDNVNSSTNWLFNITLSNTQSWASVLSKINTWTSSQAHIGQLINLYNASDSAKWVKVDMSTTWKWTWFEVVWSDNSLDTAWYKISASSNKVPKVFFGNFTSIDSTWYDGIHYYIYDTQSSATLSNRTTTVSSEYLKRTSTRTSGTTADNFDLLSITKDSTQNWVGWTFTTTWNVVNISNISVQTAWTLTDTTNVLKVTQSSISTWVWIYLSTAWTWQKALKFDTWFTTTVAPTWTTKYIIIDIWWTEYKLIAQATS